MFYARDTERVARDLLGSTLETHVNGRLTIGRIVEVEAYVGPHDPAAHGFRNKRTKRNDALFGPPGTSYVYFIYGMHWCFNAVTERDGYPGAVLVRALEPLDGLDVMCERRATDQLSKLCSGPARLCEAMGIEGSHSGLWLQEGPVRIIACNSPTKVRVARGPRIGISKARDWPLRFAERASPWLSRPLR